MRNSFGLIGNPLKLVLRAADAKGSSASERRKARVAAPHPGPPPAGEGTARSKRGGRPSSPPSAGDGTQPKRKGTSAKARNARGATPPPSPPPAGEGTRR